MYNLNDLDVKKIEKNLTHFIEILQKEFGDKTDIYIGFYGFYAAKYFIENFLKTGCIDETEFKKARACFIRILSDFQKEFFSRKWGK